MRIIDSDILLPKLVDSAIKYSPVVKRMAGTMEYAGENLVINKKNIYSSLSLNSSYNYGTNYSAINNSSGSNINNFTSSQSGFYNLGIGLQLPITQIVSRKNIIKAAEAQVKIAVADKDNAILYIKQEVIRLYQEFKLDYKLLLVSGKNKESAKVNYSMAEREFNQGQSSVDQETRVMDIYNKSVIEYETYLNRFQTAYLQLESYTGTRISQLIKQVK
jgi:outer membrane protein TolC